VDVDASGAIDPKRKLELRAMLDAATDTLKGADTYLKNGNAHAATAEYQPAAKAIARVIREIRTAAVPMSATQTKAVGASGAAGAELPEAFSAPLPAPNVQDRATRPQTAAGRLTHLIDRYDLLLNVAVLIIAAMIGLTVLWFDDPIWGGWRSYTVAFLWGLGAQQVGGASFEGITSLTRKLTE
jgi:hypothetical protein